MAGHGRSMSMVLTREEAASVRVDSPRIVNLGIPAGTRDRGYILTMLRDEMASASGGDPWTLLALQAADRILQADVSSPGPSLALAVGVADDGKLFTYVGDHVNRGDIYMLLDRVAVA